MGLCVSKKDVLAIHGRTPLSLREQMLSDLARESKDMLENCPSPSASMVSTSTMESILPTSMDKRYSTSVHLMRSLNSTTSNDIITTTISTSNLDEYDDEDDATSTTTTRFEALSTSSSPMIQSMDISYGMENVTRSYAIHKASLEDDQEDHLIKKMMKMQQKLSRNNKPQRLLEIDEEDEDEVITLEASEGELDHELMKKSSRKSLDVFGEVYNPQKFIPSLELKQQQQQQQHSKIFHPEISVFAADRYFDSESELESSHRRFTTNNTSNNWADEQHHYSASEDEDSASNMSSSTMSTAAHFIKNSRFMAVPTSHEVWPNFAHMNPSAAAARFHMNSTGGKKRMNRYVNEDARSSFSTDEVSVTTDSGDDSVISSRNLTNRQQEQLKQFRHLPKSYLGNPAGFARSSSSSSLLEDDKNRRMQERFRAHFQNGKVHPSAQTYHRKNKSFTLEEEHDIPEENDYDNEFDSDDSNDLFEIEAAMGSSSSDKEYAYSNPETENSFLKDPDISYSTKFIPISSSSSLVSKQKNSSNVNNNSKVLNPTSRANVIILPSSMSATTMNRKNDQSWNNKNKRRHQSSMRSYGMFHGR